MPRLHLQGLRRFSEKKKRSEIRLEFRALNDELFCDDFGSCWVFLRDLKQATECIGRKGYLL